MCFFYALSLAGIATALSLNEMLEDKRRAQSIIHFKNVAVPHGVDFVATRSTFSQTNSANTIDFKFSLGNKSAKAL